MRVVYAMLMTPNKKKQVSMAATLSVRSSRAHASEMGTPRGWCPLFFMLIVYDYRFPRAFPPERSWAGI